MQMHRLSTAVDVRLLGALADVRVTQRVRNDGSTAADLGSQLPVIDEQADAMCVVRGAHAVELVGSGDCGDVVAAGHARLSEDEAIADALQLAPGADAFIEVIATRPLARSAGGYRVVLPLPVEADAPRIALVDQGDSAFLLVVPHRRASAATLVLRPASSASTVLHLGAVNPRLALLIPLASRSQLDDLADGAIEFELTDGNASYWTTVAADRIDGRAVQARAPE